MTTSKSNIKATNALTLITNAISARITSAENDNQAKNFRAELKAYTLPVIEHALTLNIDMSALATRMTISDKKNSQFIAVYAMQKIRKILVASAQGLISSLDGYTRTILTNLTHSEQNNKSAYVSLSKSIEYSEFDTQKTIKARYSCAASTAGTQASSTRQAFAVLNIASVSKGKVNDEFKLSDSAIATRLISMIKDKAKAK